MNHHDDHDPLASLEDWARKTERKVQRERRLGGMVSNLRYVLMVGVAVALVAAAVPLIRSVWPEPTVSPSATASVNGVTATTSGGAVPTGPFDGTAAANYPIGAAGITLPKATAVTGFTAAEVEAALFQVRQALVAAKLDPDMTVKHHPERFLGLLSPNSRTDIAKWFKNASFASVATWIDPAVKLDPRNEPRVSGRVTYKSVMDGDVRRLRVTTNFVWVYAFQGDFAYRPLAVTHEEEVWDFPSSKNLRPADQGMWLHSAKGYSAWVDCAAGAKGLLAPTPKGEAGHDPDEDPDSLAKPDHPLEVSGGCA